MLAVFQQVIASLESAQIEYMLVGSIAAMMYGEPRLTRDMDLVIEIAPNAKDTISVLFPAPEYYAPPPEVVRQEVLNRGQFNILHIPSGLKVDLMIRKNSSHAQTEFARRQRLALTSDFEVCVAMPEDVILKKLEFFRQGLSQKHLMDIKGILLATAVDHDYIERWVAVLGLNESWATARAF